jgi:magnesium-transporting ATPase (P-type)
MKKKSLTQYSYVWRALSETVTVSAVSLLPLFVVVLIKWWSGSLTFKGGCSFSIARGELFFYAVSFVAGAYSIAISDDYPPVKKRFIGKGTVLLASLFLLSISMVFIILQRIKLDTGGGVGCDDLKWDLITPVSIGVFTLSLLMYGYSVAVRNYQHLPSDMGTKLFRSAQIGFACDYKKHRGEK